MKHTAPNPSELTALVSWHLADVLTNGKPSDFCRTIFELGGFELIAEDPKKGTRAWGRNNEVLRKNAGKLSDALIVVSRRLALDHGLIVEEDRTPELLADCFRSVYRTHSTASKALWFEEGMPTIELGHKLTASLLATFVPGEVAKAARLPFNSFRVYIPPDFILCDVDGETFSVCDLRLSQFDSFDGSHVLFHEGIVSGATLKGSNDGVTLNGLHTSLDNMVTDTDMVNERLDPFSIPTGDSDNRASMMIQRLLVNTCLLMTDPENFKEVGGAHASYRKDRVRWAKRPTRRVFRMMKKVTHDVRSVVQKYARGEGKKLDLQHFVRGHWKNQACGPKLAHHKHIFVEPYWRGPEDAPIALRPHKLG